MKIYRENIEINFIKIGTDKIPDYMSKHKNFIKYECKKGLRNKIVVEVKTPKGIKKATKGNYLVLTDSGDFFVITKKDIFKLSFLLFSKVKKYFKGGV